MRAQYKEAKYTLAIWRCKHRFGPKCATCAPPLYRGWRDHPGTPDPTLNKKWTTRIGVDWYRAVAQGPLWYRKTKVSKYVWRRYKQLDMWLRRHNLYWEPAPRARPPATQTVTTPNGLPVVSLPRPGLERRRAHIENKYLYWRDNA